MLALPLRRLSFSLACASALLVWGGAASAQEDPRKAQAEPLFQEGLALHDRGREEEALAKFKEAHAAFPSPNVLYQIARSEQLLGRFLIAIRHYREALASPLLHPKNAQLAKGFVAELEAKLARLTITGPAGAKIEVAGATVTLPLAGPLDVEPGEVVVYGTNGGARLSGKAIVREGTTGTIALTSTGGATEPVTTTDPPTTSDAAPSNARWLVPAGLGAVAVTGLVLGLVYANGHDTLVDEANGLRCASLDSEECRTRQDKLSDAESKATISKVAYGVAIVGAAGAIGTAVWFLTHPRSSSSTSATLVPSFDGRSAGLSLFKSF